MCSSSWQAAHLKGLIRVLWIPLFLTSTVTWPRSSPESPSIELIPLSEGQAIATSRASEEVITYVFDSQEELTYLIEVTQDGLDFVVTVEGPDGTPNVFDSPLQRDEAEFILLETAGGGAYRITLHSEQFTDATGSHTIQISALDAVGPELQAWQFMSDGAAANAEADLAAKETALNLYQSAAKLWRELGQRRALAYSLYGVAMIKYWDLYDWPGSAVAAAEASDLYRDLNSQALFANTVFVQAYALVELASELEFNEAHETFDRALALYEDARQIHEQLGNVYDLAHVTNFIGVAYLNRGDLQEAKRYWNEAAPLFAGLGEWAEELQVIQNLAVVNAEEGYSARAVDGFRYIIDRLPENKKLPFRSVVLSNLAAAYRIFGSVDEALRAYSSALDIQRQIEDRWGEAKSLQGIGSTYYSFGELDLAEQYLKQALPMAEEVGDGRRQAAILENLGNIAYLRADYRSALEFHEDSVKGTSSTPNRAHRQVLVSKDLTALGIYSAARIRADEANL
jgi:tetratricopeptide (TPR) repeat protein